ncbi:hypothetical protein PP939_gp191 [Rhizobium phage RL38J1]|uniref:Clamp loader subunit n=1 Tax=Rhizobium phage RL38J1 TaxID=2663232 RepID=A0A6B9J5E0_9CAUD|nr:hypothetical protein PP939_gp191 [Rhizobium phage RL38J1]QGZ13935.1 hypothetical protein RL38J1_191 [Rhizobium phage RL38J1]
MSTPFDFVKSASSSIENELLNEKLDPKGMSSFVFLRALGSFEDTVMFADEINVHSGMPARYVYHSMHALIQPKRNRFSKWIKPVEEFDKKAIARIIDLFQVSLKDAEFILRTMQERGEYEDFYNTHVEMSEQSAKKSRKKKGE